MHSLRTSPVFLIMAVLILAALPMSAQAPSSVRGTARITAANGEMDAVPGIEVSLVRDKTPDQKRTAVTDDAGLFVFSALPPGHYQLTIADSQFEEETYTVDLAAGQIVEHNFELRIRHIELRIEVKAEAPGTVDRTTSSTAAPPISQSTLQSAPLVNDRFQDALPLIPGVVRGPDGLIDIKGGRPDQSSTLVNSVSAADPVTGQEAINLPLDAVESVTVLPSPFSAEYGSFSSGVTEVETRSGTDHWKYLFTNFMPRPRWRNDTFMGLDSATPRLTIAGPLRKNRLYLFQSFDYRFERTAVNSQPALQRDKSFETFSASTKLDWNVSETNHFSSNFLWYPENVRYALLNTFLPEQSNPDFRRRGYLISLSDRAILGNSAIESAFSIKRYDVHVFPSSGELGELVYYPQQDSGDWFDRQDRHSWLEQWSETYRVGQLKAYGDHSLAIGSSVIHQSFAGQVTNDPVIVEREDRTISQMISFSGPARLNAGGDLLSLFAQDHWTPWQRLSFDMGVRLDHDSLSHDAINPAPRIGFVLAPTKDNKTVVRGGMGIFYDKIPLDVATFLQYPAETVTQFAADGITPLGVPLLFSHLLMAPFFREPYSLAWDLQLDHQLSPHLMVRLGYGERHTKHEFVLDPVTELTEQAGLELQNTGSQSYRDVETTLRWQATERTHFFASFVHSDARGDLNTFEQYFGDFPNPIIRPNQYQPLPYDAPNRFLAWGSIGLPSKFELWPVWDVHTGFPYSLVDNDLNFVGPRDSERFPVFASLDVQLVRPLRISLFGRKHTARIGLKVFNVTNHFNPRDVQNNVASPYLGQFYNSVGTQFRGKLEFDF